MLIRNRLRPLAYESLPEGYTRCEYLESTGSQRIYLPFEVIFAENEFVIETELAATPALFELSRDNSCEGIKHVDNKWSVTWGFRSKKPNAKQMALGVGISEYGIGWTYRPIEDENFHKYKLQFANKAQKLYLDDILLKSSYSDFGTFTSSQLGLFAPVGNASESLVARKKYHKQWLNGKLHFDLIPALDRTGKPCMFDLVSRTPFYNQSTTGPDFLYKTYSYPFNPPDNWHSANRKVKEIVGSTKYTLELTEDGK